MGNRVVPGRCMTKSNDFRIAISGTSGVGKSTLAKALAEKLAVSVIEESFDEFIDRSDMENKTLQKIAQELFDIFKHKARLEDEHRAFVSDRSPLDLLHLWCHYKLDMHATRETNKAFFDHCLSRAAGYDYIIFPPWGSLPIEEKETGRAGVVRNTNMFTQCKHHASTLGFAHIAVDKARIIEIPRGITDQQARLAFVIETMAKRKAILAGRTAIVP